MNYSNNYNDELRSKNYKKLHKSNFSIAIFIIGVVLGVIATSLINQFYK